MNTEQIYQDWVDEQEYYSDTPTRVLNDMYDEMEEDN